MTGISKNFKGTFFHLIFAGLPFFELSKYYKHFTSLNSNVNRQVKWIQTRKRKFQKELRERAKVAKELRESRLQLLC